MRIVRAAVVGLVAIGLAAVGPVAGVAVAVPAAAPAVAAPAGHYVAVTPVRVLDTRQDGGPLAQQQSLTLDLRNRVPASTLAVVLNLTATQPSAGGFLTVWPTGADRPTASSLNKVPGETRSNSVTVAVGHPDQDSPSISIYNALGTTQVVVDLLGYYAPVADDATDGAGSYYPVAPQRLFDSRAADTNGVVPGPLDNTTGGDTVGLSFSVNDTQQTPIGGITAVAVTITAVNPADGGYLKAWNGDPDNEPLVSTVNFAPHTVTPNFAVVPVFCVDQACDNVALAVRNVISTSTDVVVDLVGVYADPNQDVTTPALAYEPMTPFRVVDSRTATPFGPLGNNGVGTASAGPDSPAAANLTITAVDPTAGTFLTSYAAGTARPFVSNLNPSPGRVTANAAQTTLASGGLFTTYNLQGTTQVVVDVQGLFVPDGATPARAGATTSVLTATHVTVVRR